MVTAVSSFEIFNQMKPGASGIKIKKADKAVAKRPAIDFDVDLEETTGSSQAGVVTGSEFSYRKYVAIALNTYFSIRYSRETDNKRSAEDNISDKLQKKRKRVHFKSDDALCEIRYFDDDLEETGQVCLTWKN